MNWYKKAQGTKELGPQLTGDILLAVLDKSIFERESTGSRRELITHLYAAPNEKIPFNETLYLRFGSVPPFNITIWNLARLLNEPDITINKETSEKGPRVILYNRAYRFKNAQEIFQESKTYINEYKEFQEMDTISPQQFEEEL